MRHKAKTGLIAAILLVSMGSFAGGGLSSAQAQQDDAGKLQSLLDGLNALIEKGEKERLADPWYLQDLRSLAAQYDNPWRVSLYSEGFRNDGTPPAPWRVASGEFRVDWRFGLRSLVRAPAATPDPAPQSQPQRNTDPGTQILGAILQGVLAGQNKNSSSQPDPAPTQPSQESDPALALAETAISNPFKAEISFSLRDLADGSLPIVEFGVYQAAQNAYPGYRLRYSQADLSFTILRISSRGGEAVVETAPAPDGLNDGQDHALVWARYPDGRMTVSIDGTELMSTGDRGFRDSWTGFLIANQAGDLALRQLSLHGAQ